MEEFTVCNGGQSKNTGKRKHTSEKKHNTLTKSTVTQQKDEAHSRLLGVYQLQRNNRERTREEFCEAFL